MDDVYLNDLNPIELLQLGTIDKGEVSTKVNYKGRNERWFQAKKGDTSPDDLDDATD